MSVFSGRQHKGAMKDRRKEKRAQAEARDRVSAHSLVGRKKRLETEVQRGE